MNPKVLYEDNHLIAVFKPVGMLTQQDNTKDVSLVDVVKEHLKNTKGKTGNVFLGLVHRLDRPVSGIVLFAKTSKGASRVSEQFREHLIEKEYHALVMHAPPRQKGQLVSHITKNYSSNRAIAGKAGSEAILSYEQTGTMAGYPLLLIRPKTGKPHQIRVQLAEAKMPVVGDLKYGAPFPLPDKSIALCATGLAFTPATGGERQEIHIEVPETWNAIVQP